MKLCIRCGIEKPATPEFFYKNSQQIDGLHSYCKQCKALIHKEYMKNKEVATRVTNKIREWRNGHGREKYLAYRRIYDKTEGRKAWRHARAKQAKENAEIFLKTLKVM